MDITDSERTEAAEMTEHFSKIKLSKTQMLKNITVVCTGVFILCLSYTGIQWLQSTINKQGGIGVASQAILSAVTSICSLFLAEYFIKRYGSKTIFSVSIILFIPYSLANFYPQWEILIPASILNGIGVSLLWSSAGTYLNDISIMLAECLYADENLEKELPKLLPNFDTIIRKLSDAVSDEECNEQDNMLPEAFVYITGRKRRYSDFCVSNTRRQSALTLSLRRSSFTDNMLEFTPRHSSVTQVAKNSSFTEGEKRVTIQRQSLGEIVKSGKISVIEKNLDFEDKKPTNRYETITFSRLKQKEDFEDNFQDSNTDDTKNVDDCKNDPHLAIVCKKIYTEAITSRVFGILGMAFLSTVFWSNLISFVIMGGTDTVNNSNNFTCNCGAKYCYGGLVCVNETMEGQSDENRYIYFSICTALTIISFLFVFFLLDNLDKESEKTTFTFKKLLSTYEFSKKIDAIFLVLYTFNAGISTGFFLGDFTQAYSGCAFGMYHMTLSAACFGLCCAVSSTVSGWLVKYSDRKRIFSVAFVLNFSSDITLLIWEPQPSHIKMLYILSAIYGIYIGIVWSQTRALYGIFFRENQEAAFSAYYIWYYLGISLSFAVSGYFCIFEKVCVLIVVSILGFIGYVIVEKRHKRKYFMQ